MKQVLVGILLILSATVAARGTKQATLPVEREQEFTYYFYAARLAIDENRYSDAFMLLRHCEAVHPGDGQTHEYLGVIYDALGRKEEAAEQFRLAYECEPTLWQSYVQSMPRNPTGQFRRKAVKIVKTAIRQEPKEADNWEFLRNVYTDSRWFRHAIRTQDKLDDIIGYDAYSAIHRYQIYAIWGKYQKALGAIEEYIQADPTNLRFHLFRLETLERLHAPWSKMEAAFQDILKIDPGNPMILNNYAYGLATHGGDLGEAERMSQRTLMAEPNNPIFLDTYAWILHLKGQDSLAAFYIRKALDNASEEAKDEIQQHYNAIIK